MAWKTNQPPCNCCTKRKPPRRQGREEIIFRLRPRCIRIIDSTWQFSPFSFAPLASWRCIFHRLSYRCAILPSTKSPACGGTLSSISTTLRRVSVGIRRLFSVRASSASACSASRAAPQASSPPPRHPDTGRCRICNCGG